MEAPKISQKEYLKRYLSKDDGKKKKKKKLKVGVRTVKIIDQEIDLKNITTIMEDDDINILNQSEDAPQIVGIIDERNPADFSNKQKWKVIADDGTGDIAISKIEDQYRDERKKNINKRDQRLGENLSSSKKKSSKKKESRNQKNESDSDMSPPRSKTGKNRDESDSDLSPPRHKKNRRGTSSRWNEKRKRSSSPKEKQGISKTKKTLAGTNAGLRSLESLRQELEEQKRIENEKMKKINKEMRGYEQSAVQRDRKTGRRRDFEKEAADQMEKNKEQEEINAKYAVWGRGLKQMGERGDQMKRDLHEMNKPLARYADDKDLEDELKDRERDDDPMLAYIKEKRIREGKAEPEKPQFRGSYMPNRFNIRPGYRWDGVDRSNGYEKKWMDAQSANKAVEEEAYRYSTADM